MKGTGRRSSWTFTSKEKLVRQPSNQIGVSKSRFFEKFFVTWQDINKLVSKVGKNNYTQFYG
jgi:hypothetical protein